MLAGPILLDQITKYTGMDIKGTKVSVYSDNKGLITRECERQRFYTNYPSETLRPDWDLTKEIHAQYENLEINVEYIWVRGHQDKDTAVEELPIPSQYNIKAENLAEKGNEMNPG